MAKITFIEAHGGQQVVDAAPGGTLMEAARSAGVEGILADCGGQCACGTCRVYIDPEWRAVVGEAHELEAATIEAHEEAGPGKRLSCQIEVTSQFEGLIVRLPESQF